MAFKRSAVRSRLSPPRDLEREFRVFFFFAARPRFQRFHDSTLGNGLHEIAQGAFRGNRWGRGNRDFVAFVGIVGTVGFVVCAKIVETLETWKWPVPAPLSVLPPWLALSVSSAGVSHAYTGRPAFPVSFAALRTRGACNAGLNKYAKKPCRILFDWNTVGPLFQILIASRACGTAQPEALPAAGAAETELGPPSKFASRRRPAQQIWLTATKRGSGLLFASGLSPRSKNRAPQPCHRERQQTVTEGESARPTGAQSAPPR